MTANDQQFKTALEGIVRLCSESPDITGRQLRIYEIALHGLGFTATEREEKMRVQIQVVRDKIQERRDRQMLEQQQRVERNFPHVTGTEQGQTTAAL